MCFIVAGFITTSHPLRHPLQIIICVGQIYGLILYYGTSMFDHYYNEIAYSRPEAWYFWGYYFFMNFIWMVFPGSEFFLCHLRRLLDWWWTRIKNQDLGASDNLTNFS